MSSSELRAAFLEFFRARGHAVVPSSPLVPGNDPTLLFTNAGMVQFKDVFLGKDERSYRRAASSQRCVRAGGKHNDLENVGYTARHHTFFEMLGNFSFGDYFKAEAIEFAWDFVTGTLKIPAEKLWVTVYKDDDEAADLWLKKIGIDPKRFTRMDEKSNFWAMGDTGPCGPCSEIFYDHGAQIPGGPPGSKDEDGDRYVEIWNLVFMQFERAADGTMTPLPKPSVDTGMGLERAAAVMQGVHSNYDIDLFRNLIRAAADATHTKDLASPSLRVIADHIRACSFLIVDGVIPGNDGRGYVLRRIIRRAIRHGYKLGQQDPFFYSLVQVLADEMGVAYPELVKSRNHIMQVLLQEEERFAETLSRGMKHLEFAISQQVRVIGFLKHNGIVAGEVGYPIHPIGGKWFDALVGDVIRDRTAVLIRSGELSDKEIEKIVNETINADDDVKRVVIVAVSEGKSDSLKSPSIESLSAVDLPVTIVRTSEGDLEPFRVIPGPVAYKLYDTFGFPLDLTEDYAREHRYRVDKKGFENEMAQQRERARAASKFGVDLRGPGTVAAESKFTGYEHLRDEGKVATILKGGAEVESVIAGDEAQIVLARTPFYAESGGQVGDVGTLTNGPARFRVTDTKKLGDAHLHIGKVEAGSFRKGDVVTASVDAAIRQATVLNHSATHLLHAALRKVLGPHVIQKGSLVAPDRLRFDFSHTQPLTAGELESIERLVNAEIRRNAAGHIRHMGYDDAIKSGAMALFGEKYGDEVRVLSFGDFSTELCGGTHVQRTGDIGLFRITGEGGIASGVRRIEAVTGEGALDAVRATEATLKRVAGSLRATPAEIEAKVAQLLEQQKKLEREMAGLRAKLASGGSADLAAQAVKVNGVTVLAARIEGADAESLRDAADQYKSRLGDSVVVLGAQVADDRVSLVSSVSASISERVSAGTLIGEVAKIVGGRGGGRRDFAQAGGNDPAKLEAALQAVPQLVARQLGGT